MNSISHLDRFITRSLSPPSASSATTPATSSSIHSSRSLPPSPAFSNHPSLPVRRRASLSDTSRRRRISPSDASSSTLATPVFPDEKKADRKRRKSARARWWILKVVAKVWNLLVGMLFVLGMAGRSVKKGRGRSTRVSGTAQVEEPQEVGKDADVELEDDQLSVASSQDSPQLVNGLSPPLMDPRTQAVEFDPRSQAIDPSTLPYPPPPPLPPSALPSPSFEFSPPSPDTPAPSSNASPPSTRPATRSRLLLLPNPLAESSGNSLLHPSTPNAPSTPPAEPSPYHNAPLRKKTPFHKPKTLILDLDETLIHSTSRSSGANGAGRKGEGHMVEVFLGGRSTVYHVYKRPYVDYFLKKVSSWYTLVIFTASMQEYADPVIDWLDGGRGMFGKRLFRDSCVQHQNGAYIKDLSCLQEDLESICLIDNSPISYSFHQANGIPIDGWFSDPNDQALLDLLPVLDSLRFTGDVRHVLGLRGF